MNATKPIDLGGGQTASAFGRGGPVVYANTTALHAAPLRQAVAADEENSSALPRIHTGSQWVILDRAFSRLVLTPSNSTGGVARAASKTSPRSTSCLCRYLVTAPRALWWQRVFQFRFLSDEAFVQTVAPRNRVGPASRHHATSSPDLNLANRPQVLLDSPLASTMVNANLRHIYWPHYEGDPVVYWQKMGLAFVGGPQVINESQSMDIFNSPYRRPLAQPGQRWIVRAATATHPPAGTCSPASATPRWTPALSASGMVGWRKS